MQPDAKRIAAAYALPAPTEPIKPFAAISVTKAPALAGRRAGSQGRVQALVWIARAFQRNGVIRKELVFEAPKTNLFPLK